MTSNDRILLDEVLAQRKAEVDPTSTDSDFFELFTAEQVLKDYDLSYDEIELGLVGDGGDGGIDGIYVFVNGELVREDSDLSLVKSKTIDVDLIIVQAKTSAGFQETPIERFITVSGDIFDLSKPTASLTQVYNASVLNAIELFRLVHTQFASKFPVLRVSFFYASKGDKPSSSVTHKVSHLTTIVTQHFSQSQFSFSFLGATELLQLARQAPQSTYQLELAETPISSEGDIGFVCLVRLRDYFNFITDEEGHLRRQLFEANVRDYQGSTEVNQQIQEALQATHPEDFWWLNNGITILASKASQGGKALTIEDPQIVNGLQTSSEIHKYVSKCNTEKEVRKVLVRVIVPKVVEIRDRVIRANNSQTSVQQASLRATDKIHRDIEEFFRPRSLYYDRRKNFYKNAGKPRDRIISIPQLAQAVMASVLGRPDNARARPSSLLKKDEDYIKVFSPDRPLSVYYICAKGLYRIDSYLKNAISTAKDRNNIKFYVLRRAIEELAGSDQPTVDQIAAIDIEAMTDNLIKHCVADVWKAYEAHGASDQAAKGTDMLATLQSEIST